MNISINIYIYILHKYEYRQFPLNLISKETGTHNYTWLCHINLCVTFSHALSQCTESMNNDHPHIPCYSLLAQTYSAASLWRVYSLTVLYCDPLQTAEKNNSLLQNTHKKRCHSCTVIHPRASTALLYCLLQESFAVTGGVTVKSGRDL